MDEGDKPPTRGPQVVSSASELPLWGSEIHRVVLMEGAVSIPPHQGNSLKIYYLQTQKQGDAVSQGNGSPSSLGTSQQKIEQGSKHLVLLR